MAGFSDTTHAICYTHLCFYGFKDTFLVNWDVRLLWKHDILKKLKLYSLSVFTQPVDLTILI